MITVASLCSHAVPWGWFCRVFERRFLLWFRGQLRQEGGSTGDDGTNGAVLALRYLRYTGEEEAEEGVSGCMGTKKKHVMISVSFKGTILTMSLGVDGVSLPRHVRGVYWPGDGGGAGVRGRGVRAQGEGCTLHCPPAGLPGERLSTCTTNGRWWDAGEKRFYAIFWTP